jgi:two-component system phosphate regulon sensor histidine kinase PhoR
MKKEIYIEVNNSSYEYEFEPGFKIFQGGNIENKTVFVATEYNGEEIDRITRHCQTIEEWYEYIQYMYATYHHNGINLQRLDSSFTASLSANKITIPHKLELVDRKKNAIKEYTKNDITGKYKLAIDTIPLGINDEDALVVKFDNSFSGMFRQLKNIVYVSGVFVIILLFIIIYLTRTISTQIQVSKTREEYINLMIHEIRNPVSNLSRILEAYNMGMGMGMDINKYIPKATYHIENLRLMLEKLQTVSSGKQLAVNPEEINIREEMNKIAEVFTDEKTSVVVEAKSEQETIVADKLHFPNAIRNLVENASKYRKENNANIIISYWEENGKFSVSVQDDGIGIPWLYKDLIFDKGYRIPAFKSVKRLGFGLGLTYVRMVAEAHSGKVTVQSKYKYGSTFTISI